MQKPGILVVDDETELVEILSQILRAEGFAIRTAPNGMAALSMIVNASPHEPIDAVLSDLNMPELNGLQLMMEVRKVGLKTPFVFMSGFGEKDAVVEALRMGAMDFFEKPFALDQLRESLCRAVEFGVLLRTLDAELAETEARESLDVDFSPRHRLARKALLILKKQNAVTRKKIS